MCRASPPQSHLCPSSRPSLAQSPLASSPPRGCPAEVAPPRRRHRRRLPVEAAGRCSTAGRLRPAAAPPIPSRLVVAATGLLGSDPRPRLRSTLASSSPQPGCSAEVAPPRRRTTAPAGTYAPRRKEDGRPWCGRGALPHQKDKMESGVEGSKQQGLEFFWLYSCCCSVLITTSTNSPPATLFLLLPSNVGSVANEGRRSYTCTHNYLQRGIGPLKKHPKVAEDMYLCSQFLTEKPFATMDDHIADDLLIKGLHMSNLPTLSKKLLDILRLGQT